MTDDELAEMIEGLRRGDDVAIERFFGRFGGAVQSLADRRIAGGMERRFDAPEVASSVCRTFVRRAGIGEFELEDGENLWRLLCAITLTKVREKARYHLRDKRSVGRETDLDAGANEGRDRGVDGTPSGTTTPSDEVAFTDALSHVLSELDDDDRRLVDLRLQQKSTEEIAEILGCSDRTVRRLLNRLETRFDEVLGRAPE